MVDASARIGLDRSTIERVRKESGLSIDPMVEIYKDTEMGRLLRDFARAQARAEARREVRERMFLAVLRSRFGDSEQARAASRRLSEWNEDAAAEAALHAPDISAILSMEWPIQD